MDKINLVDYYVSIENLDNLPDANIDKWIGGSNEINNKLCELSLNGGEFVANDYRVTATNSVLLPFIYQVDEKWIIEYAETRNIHFFPSLDAFSRERTLPKIEDRITKEQEIIPDENDQEKIQKKKKKSKRRLSEIDPPEFVKQEALSPVAKKQRIDNSDQINNNDDINNEQETIKKHDKKSKKHKDKSVKTENDETGEKKLKKKKRKTMESINGNQIEQQPDIPVIVKQEKITEEEIPPIVASGTEKLETEKSIKKSKKKKMKSLQKEMKVEENVNGDCVKQEKLDSAFTQQNGVDTHKKSDKKHKKKRHNDEAGVEREKKHKKKSHKQSE